MYNFSANRIPKLNPSRSKPNLTLEQMAGVYQGWRTQTVGGETIRYPEVATIFADGTLIEEVTLPDGSTYTNTSSQWNFDQTGRFGGLFYPRSGAPSRRTTWMCTFILWKRGFLPPVMFIFPVTES